MNPGGAKFRKLLLNLFEDRLRLAHLRLHQFLTQ
jgi:hypothetical protein